MFTSNLWILRVLLYRMRLIWVENDVRVKYRVPFTVDGQKFTYSVPTTPYIWYLSSFDSLKDDSMHRSVRIVTLGPTCTH